MVGLSSTKQLQNLTKQTLPPVLASGNGLVRKNVTTFTFLGFGKDNTLYHY